MHFVTLTINIMAFCATFNAFLKFFMYKIWGRWNVYDLLSFWVEMEACESRSLTKFYFPDPSNSFTLGSKSFSLIRPKVPKNKPKQNTQTHLLAICFNDIFADPDFCCGMESPEMALNLTNISGPGHPNNRGPFWCCFWYFFY